jgi:NDP-sugar pyrophosphorylase family protein
MNVMLLAAGRSTRLGALGLTLPKPLVPVCGIPAIGFGLHAAARAGARRAVVNVFHRGDLIQGAIGDGRGFGIDVGYSVEEELLGTGGGLAKARALFGAVATMLLRDDPDPRRWGAIATDATGRVVGILDARSPRPPEGPVTERMFTGVQVLAPGLLDRLQPIVCDVIRDAYVPALRAGDTISAAVSEGYFAEHSTPERYLAGNLALLRDPARLSDPPGPLVGVDSGATIAADANLVSPHRIQAGVVVEAGATIGPDVVLGAGARVAAGVRLSRAVVWAGATVSADATDVVVTSSGIVAAG